LVIVPYDRVTQLATTLEIIILGDSIMWWRIGGGVLLLLFVSMSVLGVVRARAITQPIGTLTAASAQLAAGDFASHIKIETGDELQTLGEAFNEIGPHLEDRDRMKRSLEVARVVQQDLLPKVTPTLENFEVGARCAYCDQTGGDYYDFVEFKDQTSVRVAIALGDVSGHGIGAALLMASARGIFRNSARHYEGRLDKLFSHCNDQLVQDSAADKFITLFYGILDDSDRSLVWASGGHDPAIWYRQATGAFEELPNTGPPVGMFEGMHFSQKGPVHLQAGDILLIGTDGIWGAKASNGEFFGKERLVNLVHAHVERSAQEIADTVVEAVEAYIHPHAADDDVTLLVIKGRN
jgi:sigma-B regulation protein RsbU (phosphoserine phosphatase)